MRLVLPALAVALLAVPALAQTQAPAAAPAPAAAAPAATTPAPAAPMAAVHPHRMTLQQHFDQANTTHDGKLTLDQAKAGLPMVAKHFAAIDKDKKGYVTVNDIHAYAQERRAQHQTHHTGSAS
jgi:hypothetical protein